MRFWWIVAVCVVLCSSWSLAQECRSRCSHVLTTCSNVNYWMYTTNTTNVTTTESQAASIVAAAAANSSLSSTCNRLLQQLTCALSYPGCNNNTEARLTPCKRMCTDFKAACAGYEPNFPSSLAPYLDCDATDGLGAPLYSEDASCYSVTATTNQCTVNPGGFCTPWNLTQVPISGELCNPFVSSEVYVIRGLSLTSVDRIINSSAIYMIKAYNSIMPLACYKALMSYLCSTTFPGCHREFVPAYNQEVVMPIRPCYSICHERELLCNPFFDMLNITLAGCTTVAAGPIVTTSMSTSDGKTIPVNSTCQDTTFPPNASGVFSYPSFDECPSVLGRTSHPTEEHNDPRCWIKCPDASYSSDEWETLAILVKVGATLSFISMTFLLVSYLSNYEKRKFPLNAHIWQFVACLLFSLSFLMNGTNPQKNVWCADETTFATQSNTSICGVQGFMFIMFGLSVATWCCVVSFIMFRAIVFNIKVQDLTDYMKYFHVFAWGVPLVFAITAAAKNMIGYGTPLAWCFIQFKGFGYGEGDAERISIDYYVFYIPIGILFFVNLIFFTGTVVKIISVRRLQVSKNPSKSVLKSRTLQAQIRVLLFTFIVIIICFTIFQWRFQIESSNNRHEYDALGFDWVVCKIKQQVNFFDSTGNCPTDTPPTRINYPHTAAESFLLSGVGFLMSIAFGADFGIYRHWAKLFSLAAAKEWQQMHDFVRFGKDPFDSSKRSKSKTDSSTSASKKGGDDSSGPERGGIPLSDMTQPTTSFGATDSGVTNSKQIYYLA